MSLHIGDVAPDFSIDSSKGPISFHQWAGDSWVFFFSHPADFTPVCTTEMGRTAQFADKNKVAMPADWRPGDKVIIPLSVTDDMARDRFPQGWEAPRPYLRLTDVK